MARSNRLLLPPLLLLILLLSPNVGIASMGEPGFHGSYQPISNPSEPEISALAEFAVKQHDEDTGDRLTLARVLGGQELIEEGFHYRLIVGATGPSRAENLYLAMVSKMPWMTLQLTGFTFII